MSKKNKRKIVLFIVEGASDREALEIGISELYDQKDNGIIVDFIAMSEGSMGLEGDLTSACFIENDRINWVSPSNIETYLYQALLADYFDKRKILPEDLSEIIQITDTDGAYISDDRVICNCKLTEDTSPSYFDDRIECLNVENIRYRNRQKKDNLKYLSVCKTIKICNVDVPYSLYFFSCNLDHFLYNDANLDPALKTPRADEFSRKYIGNTNGFVEFFTNDQDSMINANYKESWDYLKTDVNSLRRHTNINLLLNILTR